MGKDTLDSPKKDKKKSSQSRSPSREPPLDTITTPGSDSASASSTSLENTPGPNLVVLIRHGEKPVPKSADIDGKLSRIGELRAQFLAERYFAGDDPSFFKQARLLLGGRASRRITHLVATKPEIARKKRLRMELTLRPIAEKLGLPINLEFGAEEASEAVRYVRSLAGKSGKGKKDENGNRRPPDIVLVCFPHEHLPALAREFLWHGIRDGDTGDAKWKSAAPGWDSEDYSSVWVISPGGKLEVFDMDEMPKGWEGGDRAAFFEGYASEDAKKRKGGKAKGPREMPADFVAAAAARADEHEQAGLLGVKEREKEERCCSVG